MLVSCKILVGSSNNSVNPNGTFQVEPSVSVKTNKITKNIILGLGGYKINITPSTPSYPLNEFFKFNIYHK